MVSVLPSFLGSGGTNSSPEHSGIFPLSVDFFLSGVPRLETDCGIREKVQHKSEF